MRVASLPQAEVLRTPRLTVDPELRPFFPAAIRALRGAIESIEAEPDSEGQPASYA